MFRLNSFSSSSCHFQRSPKVEVKCLKNLLETNGIILFLATNEFILGKSEVCLAKTKSSEDDCNISKAALIKTTFLSGRPAENLKLEFLGFQPKWQKHQRQKCTEWVLWQALLI